MKRPIALACLLILLLAPMSLACPPNATDSFTIEGAHTYGQQWPAVACLWSPDPSTCTLTSYFVVSQGYVSSGVYSGASFTMWEIGTIDCPGYTCTGTNRGTLMIWGNHNRAVVQFQGVTMSDYSTLAGTVDGSWRSRGGRGDYHGTADLSQLGEPFEVTFTGTFHHH
jgi:hypothetical protein